METLKNNGKTIAILPTTLNDIFPKENIPLAKNIINSGGLILSEYVTNPQNKYEKIKRFIDRDRLQAMFSNSVLLIASYRKNEGDSGSRHAIAKAKKYKKNIYVMYNPKTDKNKAIFGLNEEILNDCGILVTNKTINAMVENKCIIVDLDDTLISSISY